VDKIGTTLLTATVVGIGAHAIATIFMNNKEESEAKES
jgi:phage shock protein PspC (stress-responsive transcriptional regulator)